ncbi:hypothetical protein CBS14141_003600 [Malassezia furfur]|nr:hypothetical protein CBS14141_003600 [Malassezia furfur]
MLPRLARAGGRARASVGAYGASSGSWRPLSSRAHPKYTEKLQHEFDRLVGSLAEASQQYVEAQEPHSFYTYRRPLGTFQRAVGKMYHPDERVRPPQIPKLLYLRRAEEVDQLLPAALQRCTTIARAIGFDLEWDIEPYAGKTSVIQVCVADTIFIIHLAAMRSLPESIVKMMADPTVLKVGVAVRNDAHKLRRDFGIVSAGLVELSMLAKSIEPDRWQHRRLLISLQDLCNAYLDRRLRKDDIRISRWSRVPLSNKQLEYAASDVFVSLELFHRLVLLMYDEAVKRVATAMTAQASEPAPLDAVLQAVYAIAGEVHSAPKPKTRAKVARAKTQKTVRTSELRAHQRALLAWRAKELDFPSLAARAGVKTTTTANYVLRALTEEFDARRVAGHTPLMLESKERARLRAEFDLATVRRVLRQHMGFLRAHGVFSHAELQQMQ